MRETPPGTSVVTEFDCAHGKVIRLEMIGTAASPSRLTGMLPADVAGTQPQHYLSAGFIIGRRSGEVLHGNMDVPEVAL